MSTIETKYFPHNEYKEVIKFEEVLKSLNPLNIETLKEVLHNTNFITEDVDYTLTKNGLQLFMNSDSPDHTDINCLNYNYDDNFSSNYSELGRYYLILLEQHHDQHQAVDIFAKILLKLALHVTDDIEQSLEGYPEVSTSALNWLSAATLIEWLEVLFNYYNDHEAYSSVFNIRLCQLKMTIAAKGHYPNDVSWAMYNIGIAFELIDNNEGALQCYSAIISDFSYVLDEEDDEDNAYLRSQVIASQEKIKELS